MDKRVSDTGMPFLLYRGSGVHAYGRPPLIVFLHGSGERGDTVRTLESVLVHSLPWLAVNQRLPSKVHGMAFPFLIVCHQSSRPLWKDEVTRVIDLINEVCQKEGADPARCYLSGVSMGGGG